jgi:hypothetical protein
MARIRSIKPEFWRSPSTAQASPRARLLYIAMWNWADDYGVGEWTPRELLGFAFPNDLDIGSAEFQSLCTEVATCFDTVFYMVGKRRFYCIPAWDDHQKNERRAQGKYPRHYDPNSAPDPDFSEITEMRGKSVQVIGKSVSGTGEQGNREQGTGNRETASRGSRLKPDWVPSAESVALIRTECPTVNAQSEHVVFVDYWIAQPGAKGVKTNWDATWRNWMRRKQADSVKGQKLSPEDRARQTLALAVEPISLEAK